MFQRFTSVLFGDEGEELRRRSRDREEEEEEEEEWILVNYLAEACSPQCSDALSGSTAAGPDPVLDQDQDLEEDLVMIPSPVSSPPVRYASCTSLNSTAETDPDGGAEEHEEDQDQEDQDQEDGGFLRLDAASLEESWFVTPPPCFTGRGAQPVVLETSPLENLLIEHPSMSVYARHRSPPRCTLDPRPRLLDQGRDYLSTNVAAAPSASGGKEKARRTLDTPRHRPEVSISQRRSSLHSSCFVAAFSTRSALLQHHRQGSSAHQPLSRNALRRLNLLRPPKAGTVQLHQPSQRHLNF